MLNRHVPANKGRARRGVKTQLASKHTLKFGADIRRIQLDDRAESHNRGYWTFGSQAPYNAMENFLRGVVTTFQKGYGAAYVGLRMTELNFYGPFWPTADQAAVRLWPWYPGSKISGSLGRNRLSSRTSGCTASVIKSSSGRRCSNLMNRVQFDMPAYLSVVDTGVAGYRIQPRFGEITATRNTPRWMQMSLRYWF